jgi:hypothetical protein
VTGRLVARIFFLFQGLVPQLRKRFVLLAAGQSPFMTNPWFLFPVSRHNSARGDLATPRIEPSPFFQLFDLAFMHFHLGFRHRPSMKESARFLLSHFCNENNVKCICAKSCGLVGFMFNDFGDGFTIIDRSKNLPSHCSSSKL